MLDKFLESVDGKNVISYSKAFLTYIFDELDRGTANFINREKMERFYYRGKYDFHFLVEKHNLQFSVYDVDLCEKVLYLNYNIEAHNFSQNYSYIRLVDGSNDERFYFNKEAKSVFLEFKPLIIAISRQLQKSILVQIPEHYFDTSKQEQSSMNISAEEKAQPFLEFLNAKREFLDMELYNSFLVIVNGLKVPNSLQPLEKIEMEHVINRILAEELPSLLSSYLKLSTEQQSENRDSLFENLIRISESFDQKKDKMQLSTFRKNIHLVKERYMLQ